MDISEDLPTIVIDTREKDQIGGRWRFNKSSKTNGSILQKLDEGDYTILGLENVIRVERKASASELYQNLGTKKGWDRFKNELERLKPIEYKYLFIECSIADIHAFPSLMKRMKHINIRVTPQFILSRLIEIELVYGIRVKFLGCGQEHRNWDDVKDWINRFFYKFYKLYKETNGQFSSLA